MPWCSCLAPWPNAWSFFFSFNVCNHARHARSCPSARIARKFGMAAISADRNCRQVLISAGSGLFCGGTQRTALAIRAIDKLEPVIGAFRYVPRASPCLRQRAVEQIARIIAGKGPAGAVGAVQSRRQPHDQQPRVQRPEARDGRVEDNPDRPRGSRAGTRAAAGTAGNPRRRNVGCRQFAARTDE